MVNTRAAAAAYIYAEFQAPWFAAMVGTEIGVTSERVILKRGFLTRHTEETQLSAIEEVNVDQGFFGRLLGFGR